MIKFDAKLDLNVDDIVNPIKKELDQALSATSVLVAEKAKQQASKSLKSGLKHWEKGFSVNRIGEGEWIISLTGKLAEMMEEGFTPQEYKNLILDGNRAKHNKAQGKDYVDVPIALNADAMTGKIGRTEISVQHFRSADDILKTFTKSSAPKGVGVEAQLTRYNRVKDVISNKPPKGGKSSYLLIRRLTRDSKWPDHTYQGAKVFESIDSYIETAFMESLNKFVG